VDSSFERPPEFSSKILSLLSLLFFFYLFRVPAVYGSVRSRKYQDPIRGFSSLSRLERVFRPRWARKNCTFELDRDPLTSAPIVDTARPWLGVAVSPFFASQEYSFSLPFS